MFQVYVPNVSSVPDECCKCFCLNDAKVDLHVPYTCLLQAYVSSVFRCFIHMLASVLSGCCIYLHWFLNVFQAFSQVFQTFVSSVSSIFFYMLQLVSECFKSRLDVAHRMRMGNGRRHRRRRCGMGDVRGGVGPLLMHSLANLTCSALVRSMCGQCSDASAQIECLGASKSNSVSCIDFLDDGKHSASSPQMRNRTKVIIGHKCLKQK
jgi:hypothetical protein